MTMTTEGHHVVSHKTFWGTLTGGTLIAVMTAAVSYGSLTQRVTHVEDKTNLVMSSAVIESKLETQNANVEAVKDDVKEIRKHNDKVDVKIEKINDKLDTILWEVRKND